MTEPADALRVLAAILRTEDPVISSHVVDPGSARPSLGLLAAAGPRAAAARAEYALVVEAVREGYLLHYDRGRVVSRADPDLALLAGDHLYALGLERLATIGDLAAVRELSDLISLAAQIHDGGRPGERAARDAGALWLACAISIAIGPSPAHERAKAELSAGATIAADALYAAARASAAEAGLEGELGEAADSIEFLADPL